ncbi:hypothetical protein FLACOL7796_03311 [Flavobacterium collinsii]|uniref:Uncharacterized protein n=1 Tax=Flavobacterium collinsii TaxID=1114861 RepID=A0ABM8KLI6_9FLAO|nr:hypothetical protein FLACOL7796_03311 [Flavobacterium collinsii]
MQLYFQTGYGLEILFVSLFSLGLPINYYKTITLNYLF